MTFTRIGVQPIIVTASTAATRQSYRIVEVANGEDGETSLDVSCVNDLSIDGNANFLHWQSGGSEFKVQKAQDGQFETIATVAAQSYLDAGA